jgi:hypothetical protein
MLKIQQEQLQVSKRTKERLEALMGTIPLESNNTNVFAFVLKFLHSRLDFRWLRAMAVHELHALIWDYHVTIFSSAMSSLAVNFVQFAVFTFFGLKKNVLHPLNFYLG